MKSILANIIATSDLGLLPSIGVVLFTVTLTAIIFWTYRPGSKQSYENQAKLAVDERAS